MTINVLNYKSHRAGKYITPLNNPRCKVRIKRMKSVLEQDDAKGLNQLEDYNNLGMSK